VHSGMKIKDKIFELGYNFLKSVKFMILTSLKVRSDSKGWLYEEDSRHTMPNHIILQRNRMY